MGLEMPDYPTRQYYERNFNCGAFGWGRMECSCLDWPLCERFNTEDAYDADVYYKAMNDEQDQSYFFQKSSSEVVSSSLGLLVGVFAGSAVAAVMPLCCGASAVEYRSFKR